MVKEIFILQTNQIKTLGITVIYAVIKVVFT